MSQHICKLLSSFLAHSSNILSIKKSHGGSPFWDYLFIEVTVCYSDPSASFENGECYIRGCEVKIGQIP